MNKSIIIVFFSLCLTGFGWMYYLTDKVTTHNIYIEDCHQKIDSLETRTQILEALVEKQMGQNKKQEITIYLKK